MARSGRCAVGGRVVEVLVGKTPLSYTYAMTPREGRPFDLYDGTLKRGR